MKRLVVAGFLFVLCSGSTLTSSRVYICNSTTAKKYHFTKTCRGLSACKHDIVAIELGEAKKIGRTLCGWED